MEQKINSLFCIISGFFFLLTPISSYAQKPNEVVVYVSEDQVFSEPILKDFEKETGIKVKAVYDTEEAKSTGVMNRLVAEKDHPQADVYWANEPIRAEVLKQRGIAESYRSPNAKDISHTFKDPDGYWTGFSARIRVFVVNKKATEKPTSIKDYSSPHFKPVIANPLFGTTTTQMAALFVLWGDEKAKAFMEQMKHNKVKLSTNNGESADFVVAGESDFALVDSDDAFARKKQGKPIGLIYPDQGEDGMGALIIPNVVLLIKNGPHPETARKLVDYLLSKETERKLAFEDCVQLPLHSDVETPPELKSAKDLKVMKINYAEVAKKMQDIQSFLKDWVGY